jgi:hypothetical protein
MHRLNRAEYKNAIRDLLGIEAIDIEELLPADDASYGFDNMAGILGMSPTHLERYLTAAQKISRIAVGDVTIAPYGETTVLPLDFGQDEPLESTPFGTRGGTVVRRYFPVDATYVIRFQTGAGYGVSADEQHFVEVAVDGARVFYDAVRQTKTTQAEDREASAKFEVGVPIKGGLHTVAITFLERTVALAEDYLQPYLRTPALSLFQHSRIGGYNGPALTQLSFTGPLNVTGPGDTPSRRRIFICQPAAARSASAGQSAEETTCARTILTALARRAFRRPVAREEIDALFALYQRERRTASFEAGIRVGLQTILASPDFLFRVEREPQTVAVGSAYRISDVELASRLSFFLWSSIPDDELLTVAVAGRLHEPAVLRQQAARMLADNKAEALVSNFAGQWLRLRNVQAVLRDTRLFPDFDDNLRQAFRRETELFVGSILREDRSVLDLIRADYSFINERLARHYGIEEVYGSEFRRVTFTDGHRGGLLGQGSILTATAQPNRTSPVVRGKWILENLLGAPPPAPPANVPPLDATPLSGTLRQRMEQHRKNPVCASCHRPMDPLGFALENYDAVGAWRTHEGSLPIDAQGAMPDGTAFDGVAGLKAALLAAPDVFVTTFTERLMTYALGRGLEYFDAPAVRAVVRRAAAHDYRISDIVLGIVESLPFERRQASGATARADH